jgi:hypothetical protein
VAPRVARFLHAAFLEDLPLKLVCLVLAMLFWFYIDGELTDERELVVTVGAESLGLPEGLEVAPRPALPEFRVRVRGPRRRLQYLSPRDVSADFREAFPSPPARGAQTLKAYRRFFHLEDMDVMSVEPAEFRIMLLALSRATLPVQPSLRGNVAPGFRIEKWEVEPREVTVSARQDLQHAEFAWTDAVQIDDKAEDFQVTIGVARAKVGERDVPVECTQKVRVSFKIARKEITGVLDDQPILALCPPGTSMSVAPTALRVVVRGPPDDIQELRPADIHLYVEWPPEWDLARAPGQTFPPLSVPVKALAPPRVVIEGDNGQPLPSVRVHGQLSRPTVGP